MNATIEYSTELEKLITDVAIEIKNNVCDGLAFKIVSFTGNETETHRFIKSEGYAINYEEFLWFMESYREELENNKSKFLELQSQLKSVELSEEELKYITGGM